MSEEETMEFEGDELIVKYEVGNVVHHRGARSSLGVPEEPDDCEAYCQLTKVEAFGVDLTHVFPIKSINVEDVEEVVYETFKELMEKL